MLAIDMPIFGMKARKVCEIEDAKKDSEGKSMRALFAEQNVFIRREKHRK